MNDFKDDCLVIDSFLLNTRSMLDSVFVAIPSILNTSLQP
jgi:hypothetical protein